jgi:hypothetical protein
VIQTAGSYPIFRQQSRLLHWRRRNHLQCPSESTCSPRRKRIGRNVEKTETMAKSIATARPGAKVIGVGAVDVRKIESLEAAVERCVKELGGIDYVM